MAFERFKNACKTKNLSELNAAIKERKKTLLVWNNPVERNIITDKNTGKQFTNHPYRKVKKELAILNTIVHQRLHILKND